MHNKKALIEFSSARVDDCIRADGLDLDIHFLDSSISSLRLPLDFVQDNQKEPSDILCSTLQRIETVWAINNEKASRMLIDAIVTEVLLMNEPQKLIGFCEVSSNWEGPGCVYNGTIDYMLGTAVSKLSAHQKDSSLLIVEAHKHWPDSDIAKVLVQAGCILRNRQASGKNTPVFAVLTNGRMFRFFAVDTNRIVYACEDMILTRGEDDTYKTSQSLSKIFCWFQWMTSSINSISQNDDISRSTIEKSLAKITRCFAL